MGLTNLATGLLGPWVLCFPQSSTPSTDVEQPGTQPLEVTNLVSPQQCDNCHGGYDVAVEPSHLWRGSMMSHAGRDPLFWATVAVAEQDFGGSGDLCLRCHAARGWLDGRSTPTDGSALLDSDATGVSCDLCHSMVNPDGSEHFGVQNAPYLAHDEQTPPSGYYGSGQFVLNPSVDKLGPYGDAVAVNHGTVQSSFHRSEELCGTCHDVSNPVVGDLAHNNGAMTPLLPGTFSGVPGTPVDLKAAFNNFPWAYGAIERTTSEHAASAFSGMRISDYPSLPAELQAGALAEAYAAALASTPSGDYADGTTRTFSCQSCHMRPATGKAAKQNSVPVRPDIALHDLVGANSWAPKAILYQDAQHTLQLGGSLTTDEVLGLQAGELRAEHNLTMAAALEVAGDQLRVINLTGHKLITGFPEGRRMWLHTTWRDADGVLLREDGAYGTLEVTHRGQPLQVESLLDLHDPHTRVYQVVYGMTQAWAAQLIALGWPPLLALGFDREDGAIEHTLAELASAAPETEWHTLHFVLNNVTVEDTRIPPYGLGFDEALARSILPIPTTQFGAPGPGGVFEHFDELTLEPPLGAVSAEIELCYQQTSWEYIQFLDLANDGSVASLAAQGGLILDTWLATGMASPVVMATATWSGDRSFDEYCFCESGPCSNADPTAGCANSSGAGARLSARGSTQVTADDLVLLASGLLPGQPALLFAGANQLTGAPFGDGLRCAGGSVVRLGVKTPSPAGAATWGPGLGASGAWVPGQARYLQVWYRDPQAGPCGTGFNLSNGLAAHFTR